jgi:phenylalanyl-tRNA synthetase alpha chain
MLDSEYIISEMKSCQTQSDLDQIYQEYCGKQGIITQAFKQFGTLSAEQKKQKGQEMTQLRTIIQQYYDRQTTVLLRQEIDQQLSSDLVDIGLPGHKPACGHRHLLYSTRNHIIGICQSLGFAIEYGHDVVTKYQNFFSLNIPASHPATEMHDTFFLQDRDQTWENFVLRTHTTSMDNELIQQYGVPCKIVVPGKVYRYEDMDASHDSMFRQLEWIVIDKDMSIAHCKKFLIDLLSAIFEKDMKIRMRPAYFPFVEPWFEIDASCVSCDGKGCALCKYVGRIELLGAGMLHPNVLTHAHVDPEQYTWFAFGLGLNRLVAIKYGIDDIRYFTNWDLAFTQSFQ